MCVVLGHGDKAAGNPTAQSWQIAPLAAKRNPSHTYMYTIFFKKAHLKCCYFYAYHTMQALTVCPCSCPSAAWILMFLLAYHPHEADHRTAFSTPDAFINIACSGKGS